MNACAVAEIAALTDIYAALLTAYFAKPPMSGAQGGGEISSHRHLSIPAWAD